MALQKNQVWGRKSVPSSDEKKTRATFMVITIGQNLASYEVTACSAKARWGELYRAPDTKLKHAVAVKIGSVIWKCRRGT